MQIPSSPNPKTPNETPPSSEQARQPSKLFGKHFPGRNLIEAGARLVGRGPQPRTLENAGVNADRLNKVASQLERANISGVSGKDAKYLTENTAKAHRANLKATANNFGANAYLRSFGGNGALVRTLQQAADTAGVPAEDSKPLGKMSYASSLFHGSAGVAAAPDDSKTQLVPGANSKPVNAKDVAVSLVPFGQRHVKDLTSGKAAMIAATETGTLKKPTARLIGSVLTYLAGQRAAKTTAEIAFMRRVENDWSIKNPLLESDTVSGFVTSHPVPEEKPDGRVELGTVQVYQNDTKLTLAVHRPTEAGAIIDVTAEADAAPPVKKDAGSRNVAFLKSLRDTVPTSATATKVGAQIAGLTAASAVSSMMGKGLQVGLERANVPPPVASGLGKLMTGVVVDSTFASVFVPGAQQNGDETRSFGGAVKKVALASIPGANLFGSGRSEDDKNVVFDDAAFGLSAASEIELMSILSAEIPGSIGYNNITGVLEFDALDPVRDYASSMLPITFDPPQEDTDKQA